MAGRRPVVNKILSIRDVWKQVMKDIQYFDRNGTLPAEAPVSSGNAEPGNTNAPGVAELRVELSRMNVNISKYQKKITDQPDHKKLEQWKEDLAKMEAMKQEMKQQIVKLTYETA